MVISLRQKCLYVPQSKWCVFIRFIVEKNGGAIQFIMGISVAFDSSLNNIFLHFLHKVSTTNSLCVDFSLRSKISKISVNHLNSG